MINESFSRYYIREACSALVFLKYVGIGLKEGVLIHVLLGVGSISVLIQLNCI